MGKRIQQWVMQLNWYWCSLLGAVLFVAPMIWQFSWLSYPSLASSMWWNLFFLLCFFAGLFCLARAAWLYISEALGVRPDPPLTRIRTRAVAPVARPKQEHWILDPAAIATHESVGRRASRTACVMPRHSHCSQAEPQPILLQDSHAYRNQYHQGGER